MSSLFSYKPGLLLRIREVDDIRELISLGTLNDIIQHQHRAVVTRFEDEDVLVFGFLVVEYLVDFEGHGLTGPHVGDLTEPAICSSSSLDDMQLSEHESICGTFDGGMGDLAHGVSIGD